MAAVTSYAEPSSLGTCYDRFARCSLFYKVCFWGFFFRNWKEGSRSKIWYILLELLRVDLNVLNRDEGDSFVHHSVASLRALIKSFREQVSP